jgi:hypothetical protein
MTILDKVNNATNGTEKKGEEPRKEKVDENPVSDSSQLLSQVESQFKDIMSEFRANAGFSVDTGEKPYSTMIELLSSAGVNASITVLLSFIRFCINHNLKKEITVKIGFNKPTSIPMNFAVNEELLEEIYPGDTVEIN